MTLTIDPSAIKRIQDLRTQKNAQDLMLRIIVDGGGCSGFQYKMDLTSETTDTDITFENCVTTDKMSLVFLKDSVISFTDELIGSDFKIDNPNAIARCGCGTSFSV